MNELSDGELEFRVDEILSDPEKLLATIYKATNDPIFMKIISMLISDDYKKDKESVLKGIRELRWDIEDRVLKSVKEGKL